MILPHDQLRRHLQSAVNSAYPNTTVDEIRIEPTKDRSHGDYASTVALKLAPILKESPMDIAQHLVAKMGAMPMLDGATVAQPGFINFRLKPEWLMKQAEKILSDAHYGENNSGKNQRAIVEFVSANPTGPLTLANGRGAFAGTAFANILAMNGWQVSREYYVNDVGNQVNILAESVIRRYYQLQGIPTDYPEYCYQGEYVTDLAKRVKLDHMKVDDMRTIRDRIKGKILDTMIADIRRVLEKKLGVKYDSWFRESALYAKKLDEKALDILRGHDVIYEQDGATWFRTSAFGDDKDRVLIKRDGEKTYFLSDIALRWYRFGIKKYEREYLFLGADHHGYMGRLQAAMAALGFAQRLDLYIVQLVRLIRGGQEVKMSKRAGTYVTLEEVVEEVGSDVARFFFLMHGPNTHMDFNLDAAKEKSEKNPVYYVQYAHARICSILKKGAKLPSKKSSDAPHPAELELVKTLLQFPVLVAEIAATKETQKLPFYSMDVATKFHDFYTNCRVIDEEHVIASRQILIEATQAVLAKTLKLMGVSAPTSM